MTKPDITAVPTLSGRELDAAVHEFVMGKEVHPEPDVEWLDHEPIPHYSRDRDPSIFDVMAKVRSNGWVFRIIENLSPDDDDEWIVWLTFCHGGQYSQRESGGSNLNEAIARAALQTTYITTEPVANFTNVARSNIEPSTAQE